MELEKALRVSPNLVALFAPVVSEIVIAGSVRRRKPEVKDLELVACLREDLTIPHAEHTLSTFVLDGVIKGYWELDRDNPKNGRRYKRFVIEASGEMIVVELFIADASNFGNTLAIRTGDADWTRLMVTRGSSGLMPSDLRQADGYLWRGEELLPCRTEAEYFTLLGIPMIEPAHRNKFTALELIRERNAQLCPR